MTFDEAYALALKKLKTCDRFERELRPFLTAAEPEIIDQVIERLRSHGILNEQRIVDSVIGASYGRSGVGRDKMSSWLLERGAPSDAVEAALAELPVEVSRAVDLLQSRPPGPRAKLGRFLFSRGFDEDTVESALNQFFEASE